MRRKILVGGLTAGALGVTGLLAGAAVANSGGGTLASDSDMAPVGVEFDDSKTTEPTPKSDDRDDDDSDDRHDDGVKDSKTPSAQQAGLISMDEAVEKAQQHAPDARLTEVELEYEHGRLVWSVEFAGKGNEYEVYVDARSGEVLKVEVDDDKYDDDQYDHDRHDDDKYDHDDHDDD